MLALPYRCPNSHPHPYIRPHCFLLIRDDEKSATTLKGLGECVPFEGEGDDGEGASEEDTEPPAKKKRGRPAAGGSKKGGKGSAKKGKGKAKR